MTERNVKVIVRRMTEDDIDAVLSLGGNMVSRYELMSLGLEGPLDFSFVAEVDDHIIGFNLAQMQYVGIPLTRVCLMYGIVVEYEYRRHGIGNRLVEGMLECCDERGVRTVRALVKQDDAQLQRFISQLGFTRSTIDNYDKTVDGKS
jgi:N-acetylglutamate synthase-like GNAT family acetyltransferase